MAIKRKRLDGPARDVDLAPVRHYNQRYAFVLSERLDAASGVGASPVVLGLMGALARKGKKVALVAPPAALRMPPPLIAAWFNRCVAGVLSGLETDVVIGYDGDGYRFARSARRDTPFVCFVTGVVSYHPDSRLPLRDRLRSGHLRSAAAAADLVVVGSRYARSQTMAAYGLPPERVAVVPPAVDTGDWPMRALPEHDRPRLFALAAGATDADFAWLLDGCVRARRAGAPLQVQVSAAAHLKAWSQTAARAGLTPDNIVVDDRCRRSDIKAELGVCDVFVQLARRSAGLTHVLWAMATGRPVIVPDAGEFPEIAGDAAIPVLPGDGEALGQALAQLLASREAAQARAQNAVQRALTFTWEQAARNFGEQLAEL